MIFQFIQTGYIDIPMILALIVILIIGMGFHEYGHAAMADWWGDPTPRSMGRLTINPLVHINWMGFLMFLVVGFGTLGSVPINRSRMRDPRWGSFWTSFAGPLTNLLLAIVSAIVLRLSMGPLLEAGINSQNETTLSIITFIVRVMALSVSVNAVVFVFNLLPFYPLDGWSMALALLPSRYMDRSQVPQAIRRNAPPLSAFLQAPAYKWQDWAQISQFVLIAMVMISLFGRSYGFPIDPLNLLINQPVNLITSTLTGF